MYLYEKNNDIVSVYELKGEHDKLVKFRRDELASLPESEQVMYANAKVKDSDDLVLTDYAKDSTYNRPLLAIFADNDMRGDFWEYRTYHKLLNQEGIDNTEVLFNYYNGVYNDHNAVAIHYLDLTKKYLLLTQGHYICFGETEGIQTYRMFNLINLPVSLYILQMIEKGRFKDIEDMNIDKVMSLFKLSHLYDVHTDMFNDDALANVNNKIEKDSYLLKRIK